MQDVHTPRRRSSAHRRGAEAAPARPRARRWVQAAVVFIGCVVVVNALVGEKGLIERRRAYRKHAALAASVAGLRQDNARLRDEARRLREDPATIEAIARRDLGLIRPGEFLFIIRDVPTRSALR